MTDEDDDGATEDAASRLLEVDEVVMAALELEGESVETRLALASTVPREE